MVDHPTRHDTRVKVPTPEPFWVCEFWVPSCPTALSEAVGEFLESGVPSPSGDNTQRQHRRLSLRCSLAALPFAAGLRRGRATGAWAPGRC